MIYPPLNKVKCKYPERICCIGLKKEENKWINNDCPNINSCKLEVCEPRFMGVKKMDENKLKEEQKSGEEDTKKETISEEELKKEQESMTDEELKEEQETGAKDIEDETSS